MHIRLGRNCRGRCEARSKWAIMLSCPSSSNKSSPHDAVEAIHCRVSQYTCHARDVRRFSTMTSWLLRRCRILQCPAHVDCCSQSALEMVKSVIEAASACEGRRLSFAHEYQRFLMTESGRFGIERWRRDKYARDGIFIGRGSLLRWIALSMMIFTRECQPASERIASRVTIGLANLNMLSPAS